jgi:iron(III) transport system substrate-binding protein
VQWLVEKAAEAGFKIDIDYNSVISGDTQAIQAADEKKDGDIIFGLNETRWGQLINGEYANLKIIDWTPSWADQVGDFKY